MSPIEKKPWRETFLLRFRKVNLPNMVDKADRQVYKSLAHFRLDIDTFVHNVAIFYGGILISLILLEPSSHIVFSPEHAARAVQQHCLHELNEINLCSDCYERSNEREDDDWFCLPCNPPHELVYAKAKGFPYWPAKASET